MRMRVLETSTAGGAHVVEVTGEIDIATVEALEERLLGAIEAGHRPVLLDLGHCTFIDSTGIHLLLRAHARLSEAGEAGPSLVLVARGRVLNLFRVTALDRTVPIAATREEAELLLGSAGAKV